jgi:hypothetical protein
MHPDLGSASRPKRNCAGDDPSSNRLHGFVALSKRRSRDGRTRKKSLPLAPSSGSARRKRRGQRRSRVGSLPRGYCAKGRGDRGGTREGEATRRRHIEGSPKRRGSWPGSETLPKKLGRVAATYSNVGRPSQRPRDAKKLAPTQRPAGIELREPMQAGTLRRAKKLGKRFHVALKAPAGCKIGSILAFKLFGAVRPRAAVQGQTLPHGDGATMLRRLRRIDQNPANSRAHLIPLGRGVP